MGSSSSSTENKNKYIITYRVKLPETPILTKEKDKEKLFIYTIEEIEKAKVYMSYGNQNLRSFFALYQSNLIFISFAPVILLFFYRRFRIKKKNSHIKSFVKSFPIFMIYYFSSMSYMGGMQSEFYLNFFTQDMNKTNEEIGEYLHFKDEYMKKLI
jgi:hypothetical protein